MTKLIELELIDWKNAEKATIEQIRQGLSMTEIGNLMLIHIELRIHGLGGLTREEEKKKHAADKKKGTTAITG